LSEDSSYSSAENSVTSKPAERSSTAMNLSSFKTTQSQLFEGRSVQNCNNSDFVFGENMVERVLVRSVNADSATRITEAILCASFVFLKIFPVFFFPTETALLRNATLTESAAACTSKPVEKILLDKVEVITGEEAEHNVLQINCKLFVFNKLSLTWIERGRGSLKLNDTSSNKCGMLQSRLTISLLLKISVRLFVKNRDFSQFGLHALYVLQASSKDTECLYTAIHHRLVALRSFAEPEPDANQVDSERDIAFQPLKCDSDDEDDEEITQVSS
ncbi:RNB3L protein, partial [Jacana jacana]|nr:RNB3L protein [Jacana jacana]